MTNDYMMSILTFFAKRFVAGETLEQSIKVIKKLKSKGFYTTLDHLGENTKNKDEAIKATNCYLEIIKELKNNKLNVNVSAKLTQLGLDIDKNLCLENVKKIGNAAKEANGFVRIDMEGSNTTTDTLDIVKKVKAMGMPVGSVIQAMLRRSSDDVISLLEHGATIRLCKGAYKEPVEIAYQDKTDVNKQFIALMKRLITSGLYHGIATHDDHIIHETISFAKSNNIDTDKFEFQFLLGMRRKLQKQLIKDGWKVRIYVPYGCAWLPYMLRRLRERKENVWFFVKNFFRA